MRGTLFDNFAIFVIKFSLFPFSLFLVSNLDREEGTVQLVKRNILAKC